MIRIRWNESLSPPPTQHNHPSTRNSIAIRKVAIHLVSYVEYRGGDINSLALRESSLRKGGDPFHMNDNNSNPTSNIESHWRGGFPFRTVRPLLISLRALHKETQQQQRKVIYLHYNSYIEWKWSWIVVQEQQKKSKNMFFTAWSYLEPTYGQ